MESSAAVIFGLEASSSRILFWVKLISIVLFFRRFTAIITDMITVITVITVTHYKMGFPILQIGFFTQSTILD